MNRLNKVFSCAGWGIGGFAMSSNNKLQLAVSGEILLGLMLLLCLTFIIIVYRVSNKVDLVALIKAWRSKTNVAEPISAKPPDESVREG